MEYLIKSKKFGEHIVLIDEDDYEKIKNYKWYLTLKEDGTFYVATTLYYNGKKHMLRMHRLILDCKDKELVDHINNNGLDNRKSNLRIASYSTNGMNRKKLKNCSSKYKGVCFNKRDKVYHAYIRVNYKRIFLGVFKNEDEAGMAYNNGALKYHKEFALLNEV